MDLNFWHPDINIEHLYAQTIPLEAQRLLWNPTPLTECGEAIFKVARQLSHPHGLTLTITDLAWPDPKPNNAIKEIK